LRQNTDQTKEPPSDAMLEGRIEVHMALSTQQRIDRGVRIESVAKAS
jgi:hypothetical protein